MIAVLIGLGLVACLSNVIIQNDTWWPWELDLIVVVVLAMALGATLW